MEVSVPPDMFVENGRAPLSYVIYLWEINDIFLEGCEADSLNAVE